MNRSIKGEEDVPEILELFRMQYVPMSAAERKYNVEIKRKDEYKENWCYKNNIKSKWWTKTFFANLEIKQLLGTVMTSPG